MDSWNSADGFTNTYRWRNDPLSIPIVKLALAGIITYGVYVVFLKHK